MPAGPLLRNANTGDEFTAEDRLSIARDESIDWNAKRHAADALDLGISASRHGMLSPAGDAVTMLPAIVPRFWI